MAQRAFSQGKEQKMLPVSLTSLRARECENALKSIPSEGKGQSGKNVFNTVMFLPCGLTNSPTPQYRISLPSLRSNYNLLPYSGWEFVCMFLNHKNKLSSPDCHHSPFLTNIQPLFLLTEPHWWFLTIFIVLRLLPLGNYNHAISLDLVNTPPQILVLLFSVWFSSHKWLQFYQCHTALLPDTQLML